VSSVAAANDWTYARRVFIANLQNMHEQAAPSEISCQRLCLGTPKTLSYP
jgi:hypothetical protein